MKAHDFTGFLKDFGEVFPPSLRYDEGMDIREWQREFRAAMDALRGPLPERAPLDVDTVEIIPEAGFARHRLQIRVSDISTLPAYLLVPDGLSPGEKRPGLIVSHGHAAHGIDSICGVRGLDCEEAVRRAYALHAVRAGYVVLTPSWWGWTGRDGHVTPRIKGGEDMCNRIQMAASMYGLSVLSLHIQDGQAALDVLTSRPEVDAERIGCIGNSYGGRTTMWLTVYDSRIRAAVASGCMNTFRERSLKLSACGIQYLPGMLRYGDVPEVLSLIAPRPLQLQAGQQDNLLTPADRDAMERVVRRAYRQHHAEDQFDYVLHPDIHIMLWEPAERFLRRHLG